VFGFVRARVPYIRDRIDHPGGRIDHRRADDPDRRCDVSARQFFRGHRRADALLPFNHAGRRVELIDLVTHGRHVHV
jgi:hypothetical protein